MCSNVGMSTTVYPQRSSVNGPRNSARKPSAQPRRHGAHRVRPKRSSGSGALSGGIALFVAATLAAASVALATRSWWKKGDTKVSGSAVHRAAGERALTTPASPTPTPTPTVTPASAAAAAAVAPAPVKLQLPAPVAIPVERRVYLFEGGKAQVMRDDDARLASYSVIDLSDDFVPYIFREKTPGTDDFKKNDYRRTFINIANDIADEAGKPLAKGDHNYVELYGIPPSLSVLRKRFLDDDARPCYGKLRGQVLRGYRGAVRYEGGKGARAILDRYKELKSQVRRAMRRTGARNVGQLRKRGKAYLVKKYRLYQTKLAVINQASARLQCEGLFRPGERVTRLVFGYSMHRALARFERKHMLYGWGQLFGKTLRALGRSPLANNYAAFKRALRERVVHSLGIIEYGTAPLPGAKSRKRRKRRGPNLVGRYTQRVLQAMDLTTADKALAFFKQQPVTLFKRFRVAVKLPKRPSYYGRNMRFEVVIDRGDVWYDPPYYPSGKRRSFFRRNRPTMTLYTVVGKRRIPLAQYNTTIGGWRTEYRDGKEYVAYKGSDVGPRIWRDVVAGPVWIPPATTSPKSLLKYERKDGKWSRRVNRKQIGPSYASAYGLVAAYHIEESRSGRRVAWKDNGIRTHGSVDYMSILTRYSHGCHRLHNHLALRLFSFIVRHSKFVRRGQVPLAYAKRFNVKGRGYKIRLKTRGYYYTLRHPVRVMVTEGRIMGKQKTPIEHYLRKPGVTYGVHDPNLSPAKKLDNDAKDSADGYKPTGALPAEAPSASEKLRPIPKLDPGKLPPPPSRN